MKNKPNFSRGYVGKLETYINCEIRLNEDAGK